MKKHAEGLINTACASFAQTVFNKLAQGMNPFGAGAYGRGTPPPSKGVPRPAQKTPQQLGLGKKQTMQAVKQPSFKRPAPTVGGGGGAAPKPSMTFGDKSGMFRS
jgi:hypothetical protein